MTIHGKSKILVTGEALKRAKLVTDPPKPDCPLCSGRGTVGGCRKPDCTHMHTYSFCPCVNERYEDR